MKIDKALLRGIAGDSRFHRLSGVSEGVLFSILEGKNYRGLFSMASEDRIHVSFGSWSSLSFGRRDW